MGHDMDYVSVWEHIAPLIATGLDGVIVQSTPDPPYFGRTSELWEALKPHCEPGTYKRERSWYTTTKRHIIEHNHVPGGFLQFDPYDGNEAPALRISATVRYKNVGAANYKLKVPGDNLDAVFAASTQGASPPLPQWLLKPLWRHYDKVVWRNSIPFPELVAARWAAHRCLDALGMMMSIQGEARLAGTLYSFGAGHAEDFKIAELIYRDQIRIR
jgi:hypothetical protein